MTKREEKTGASIPDGGHVSVPELSGQFRRHVFITHCEDDYEFAKKLFRGLSEKGFVCGLAKLDFHGGIPIYEQVMSAIETSQKILAIVSSAAMKSFWFNLELGLTLERSIRNDCLAIVPVLRDVSTEELPDVLRQFEFIDVGSKGYLMNVIRLLIGPDVPVKVLLPVGNVGHGLAWSYYCSFLRFVLPGLIGRMEKLPFWRVGPSERNMPRKIYLLLPESCKCPGTLTEVDERIMAEKPLEPVNAMRAGKPRKYHNAVYKILHDKAYYFVGEFCSVVAPLYAMEEGGIANLTPDEKRRQMYRFKCSLESILDHSFRHMYEIILFNDQEQSEPLSDRLLRSMKADIQADIEVDKVRDAARISLENSSSEEYGEVAMDTNESCVATGSQENFHIGGQGAGREHEISQNWDYDAFITNSNETKDVEFAISLTHTLEDKYDMKCIVKDRDLMGDMPLLDQIRDAKKRSKRTILILSEDTTENMLAIFRLLRTPDCDDLSEAVQPIPLLLSTEILNNKSVSDLCKYLTYVEKERDDWEDRLVKALRAEVVQPCLPAGNVAEGFAWSFFYGYLKKQLPKLRDCMKQSSWYDDCCQTVSPKMFFFMPNNGRMLDKLDDFPEVERVEFVVRKEDIAGNTGRNYDSCLYKIQDKETGQVYYFVGEYVAPLAVIQDMETGQEAGMSSDARAKQVTLFYRRLEEIMNHEHARHLQGLWRFFRYGDSKESHDNVWQDILQMIKEDLKEAQPGNGTSD